MLNQDSLDSRDSNIGLNALLRQYLGGIENSQKEAIVSKMKTDPSFWWKVSNIRKYLKFLK
jgi:hypothetical protein